MPFYVSFRAMLRCLCEMVAKAYGNKSFSFILLLAWWLLLPELFDFCIPTKKYRKKESSVIFYTSSCCKSGCESKLRSTGKTQTVCSEHWELTPHKCSESFTASLHWFSIHCGKWIMVLKMHLFFEGRKKAILTVINAALYNCNKYICLDFSCWNRLLDQCFHSETSFFSILLAPSPL